MNQKLDVDQIKDRIKEYLPQYLESHGYKTSNGLFRCINPDHQDHNPSAGIVPGTENKVFHCFSCHCAGDIFLAAHFIEDKPMSGRGFISDNLIYLAQKYGIDIPDLNLTDDELYEMETFRATANAAMIIKNSAQSERVKARLAELGWPKEICYKIGIGSVSSFEDYIEKMVSHYKHKLEFLKEVDLARGILFNENNLIFIIKDENGAPVGFAARNLKYEEDKAKYDKDRVDIIASEGSNSSKLDALWKPSKYINTESKSRIYQKSKRLFNFNLAKKSTPPLYVFEGYSDCVTAYCAGIKNSCSIGSTSFSKDHLDLVLGFGVKHIIFVLDADDAGEIGTARFVKLLEENLGGHVGLRIEIIAMPEGSDDPDSYIRKFGFEQGNVEFRKLERLDIFSWRVRKGMKDGEDPISLAQKTIPLIVNEPNYLQRMDMTNKLSKHTGMDYDGLWREVVRLVDSDEARANEEKSIIARRIASDLLKNSKDASVILSNAVVQIEMVDKQRIGYDPMNTMRSIDRVFKKTGDSQEAMGLLTGYKILDHALNGIPKEQVFVSIPGKPNQGKSTFLDNLTIGIVENNKNAIVLFHTVDDALVARITRLLAAKYNIPSEYFLKAGYYLNNKPAKLPAFEEIYHEAQAWLIRMVEEERIILADVSDLPQTLPALENWIKTIRKRHSSKSLVVMGDNFHLYDLPGHEAGESKVREMSMFIKRMCNQHFVTSIFTMELPKGTLNPGTRPRLHNIKGSSGMPYDVNVNLGIYNDLKDLGEKSVIYWNDSEDLEHIVGTNGEDIYLPKKKPIIELVIDKSKISSFDGSIFFRLNPDTGRMEECSESEQTHFKAKSVEAVAPKGYSKW
jgi:DNA primase/KaiC/GvpD/RAD55 family RecA-like ATPase